MALSLPQSTIIVDAGSFSARFGFSGDDAPAANFRSMCGHFKGDRNSDSSSASFKSKNYNKRGDLLFGEDMLSSDCTETSILYPIKDGVVEDWDTYTELWRYGYDSLGLTRYDEASVIITEKSHTGATNREKMGEILFESLKIPSLFIARDAALSMYACGRTTGLVIDCGASGTSISPVIDGWVESRGLSRSVVGGNYMDAFALHLLRSAYSSSKSGSLVPLPKPLLYSNSSKARCAKSSSKRGGNEVVDSTYKIFANLEMAREFKESSIQVSPTPIANPEEVEKVEKSEMGGETYQLPDGTKIRYSAEKFQCAELIFEPSKFEFDLSDDLELFDFKNTQISSLVGIPKLASDAVLRCDVDVQLQLLANVAVVGGSTSPDGIPERMRHDIEALLRRNYPQVQVKEVSPKSQHRSIAAWLGGSILGSMGSIHELSLSKKEYDEFGASSMEKKFP